MNKWETKNVFKHGSKFSVYRTNYGKAPYTLSINGIYLARVKNTSELTSYIKHFSLKFLLEDPK